MVLGILDTRPSITDACGPCLSPCLGSFEALFQQLSMHGLPDNQSVYVFHVCRQEDEQKRIREDAYSSTMKYLVTLLCLISALVSALSYKCYSGFLSNSTTCKESEIECLGDRCMTCSQYVDRVIPEDPTPNGLKCSSVFCIGTFEECNSTEEMNCTGSMNRCFQYRGQVQYPGDTWKNVSAMGCINCIACRYNIKNIIAVPERPGMEIIC
ncbi:uncharacterized protein ACNLHF_003089 [Anomaloglossus baeobatrachus]|uniref:uncharacterized protein LOC142256730 n=1 Tax=Anomaloglossus baeobatrachus TaxID=238106 RepID=UPI003F4F9B0A